MTTYTAKQHEVLEIISNSVRERGIAPTLQEIAEELGGISRVSVLDHLRALEKKGAIRRRARESRAIEILDANYSPLSGIRMVGTIAAGEPILAFEENGTAENGVGGSGVAGSGVGGSGVGASGAGERIVLDEWLGAREDTFLLRVTGESMIEDHIVDGDLVLVERSTTARDGEIVVAIVSDGGDGTGEATLKRFYREKGAVRLVPANPRLREKRYPPSEVEIRGVVRGVVRRT